MRKKILIFSLMLTFILSCVNIVYAQEKLSTVKMTADGELTTENVNLDAFIGIAPGDTRVQEIAIVNDSDAEQNYYLLEETISNLEATNKAAGGAYVFDIRVGETYDSSNSILTKKVGGFDGAGDARENGLADVEELSGYTFLTNLDSEESINLFISLQIIGEGNDNSSNTSTAVEGTNGLGYTNAIGQIKLSFKTTSPSHQGEKKTITKTIEKVKKKYVTKYVKTGDSIKLFVFAGILVLGIFLLVMMLKKKKISKKNVGLMILLSCILAIVPVSTVKAASSISVTFRAGESGKFNVTAAKNIAVGNVEIDDNYLRISVEKPQSGEVTVAEVLKSGFGTSDADYIFGQITEHKNYSLLPSSSWNLNVDSKIRHNTDYVLKYGVLVDPVMYTVRFMDVDSYDQISNTYINEVAAPVINYGNAGDVITVKSAMVDDYATTEEEYTFTLDPNSSNNYSFYYAYTGESDDVVEVTYETKYTTLTEEQVIRINNATDNGDQANNPNNPNAGGDDANNIDDENVPEADNAPDNQDNDNEDEEITDIEDGDTPLDDGLDDDAEIQDPDVPYADGSDNHNSSIRLINIVIISCVVAFVIAIIAITLFIVTRRKQQS